MTDIEKAGVTINVNFSEILKGDKGDPGEQGPVGPQGPQGEKGEKGDPGSDANVRPGTMVYMGDIDSLPAAPKKGEVYRAACEVSGYVTEVAYEGTVGPLLSAYEADGGTVVVLDNYSLAQTFEYVYNRGGFCMCYVDGVPVDFTVKSASPPSVTLGTTLDNAQYYFGNPDSTISVTLSIPEKYADAGDLLLYTGAEYIKL